MHNEITIAPPIRNMSNKQMADFLNELAVAIQHDGLGEFTAQLVAEAAIRIEANIYYPTDEEAEKIEADFNNSLFRTTDME